MGGHGGLARRVALARAGGPLLGPARAAQPDEANREGPSPELWGACEALGVDVPDTPFPRLHDTNEFRTEFGLEPIPA